MNEFIKKILSSLIISYAIYIAIILSIYFFIGNNAIIFNYKIYIYVILLIFFLFLYFTNKFKFNLKVLLISLYIPILQFTYFFILSVFSIINFMKKDSLETMWVVLNNLDIVKVFINEYWYFNKFTLIIVLLLIIHFVILKFIFKKTKTN